MTACRTNSRGSRPFLGAGPSIHCAPGETRTLTTLRPPVPETGVVTNYTTEARNPSGAPPYRSVTGVVIKDGRRNLDSNQIVLYDLEGASVPEGEKRGLDQFSLLINSQVPHHEALPA